MEHSAGRDGVPAPLGGCPDELAPEGVVLGRRRGDASPSATAVSDAAAAALPGEAVDATLELLDEDAGKLADPAPGVPAQAVVQPLTQMQPAEAALYKPGAAQSAA